MVSKKLKIMIFYRGLHSVPNAPTISEQYHTVLIINECYLHDLLANVIREDIERIEVEEYGKR